MFSRWKSEFENPVVTWTWTWSYPLNFHHFTLTSSLLNTFNMFFAKYELSLSRASCFSKLSTLYNH